MHAVDFAKFILKVIAVVAVLFLVLKPSPNELLKGSPTTNAKRASAPVRRLMVIRLIIIALLLDIIVTHRPFERGIYPMPDTWKGAAFVALVFIVADFILDLRLPSAATQEALRVLFSVR